MVKILIGLICGNDICKLNWAKRWYENVYPLVDHIVVIDNSTDGTGNYFRDKSKITFYIKQVGLPRHNNRDYQQILDRARELDCDWVLNLDLDEEFDRRLDYDEFHKIFDGQIAESFEFMLFEMWDDENHYLMIGPDKDKHARRISKMYKVKSHLQHNMLRTHGCSIPENCLGGPTIDIRIKHFGHMTKELRKQKLKMYNSDEEHDNIELKASWFKEEGNRIAKWVDWDMLGVVEYET